ncbi:MAG: alpha/beta hydrolase [Ahrensia sp.]|nr:alpha/beta hydrolase [Ahrensia sp.]
MSVSYVSHGTSEKAVIYLHGVGSGKEGWMAQRDATVEAGFRFVAIDAPGFGSTPLPDAAGFGSHVQSVLDVMQQEGLEEAVLCGHSMGGMTAQEFYAQHPQRASALVLSGTSPAFGKANGDFQKAFLRARFEPFDQGMSMPEFANAFSADLLGSAASDDALRQIIEVMSPVSIPAYRRAVETLTHFDRRDNLPSISVPVLLIAGEEDENAPAKMMEKMASYISNATYVELEKTGHMAPVENADAFNQNLGAFLSRLGLT